VHVRFFLQMNESVVSHNSGYRQMPGYEPRYPSGTRAQQAYQPAQTRGIDAIKEDPDMSDADLLVLELFTSSGYIDPVYGRFD
jgi:hypothetical protein